MQSRMFRIKLRTARQLGISSLLRYFSYRVSVKSGLNPVRRLTASVPEGPFYRSSQLATLDMAAPDSWNDTACYFGWYLIPLQGKVPDWHFNPFSNTNFNDPYRPWWTIPDFDPDIGDIKVIWETSRFDWVVALAVRARCGDDRCIARLNSWLGDWIEKNPPYLGPNWKCGQEASIRVIHLATAALLLGQARRTCPNLLALVYLHLQRISPTISYAVAQNNNHGTSEAAALFIGGSWLSREKNDAQANRWKKQGRRWLENRVTRLVAEDGSFSQYSVNYHRLLLDTLSITEIWRRHAEEPPFSALFVKRSQAATRWLHAFTSPQSGDVPNIGGNDGARLLPLTPTDYRDYRPSVQLAASIFLEKRAYVVPEVERLFELLGVSVPDMWMKEPSSQMYDLGGYASLRTEAARVFLKYPRYEFRPSHADALHVDLWIGDENLLRDAGSYRYAADASVQDDFRTVRGHNTIQFDDRDQMPRLGRFLYGAWLQTTKVTPISEDRDGQSMTACYEDWLGAHHCRRLFLRESSLIIEDEIDGFERQAVLRWRLSPDNWSIKDMRVTCGRYAIKISADMPILRMELVRGWESRYYHQRTSCPVLEVTVAKPGNLMTHISWMFEHVESAS